MITIYKYEIPPLMHGDIAMPRGSEILCVDVQDEKPFLWAKADTEEQEDFRKICVFGTGHEIEANNPDNLEYIGTFFLQEGALVFHVFEML